MNQVFEQMIMTLDLPLYMSLLMAPYHDKRVHMDKSEIDEGLPEPRQPSSSSDNHKMDSVRVN
jgi:hypothetical protein